MDFAIAALFMLVYGTSYHALKDRAKLAEGETLLVLGASGGVGLVAVELGVQMGAKVIAGASSDEKLALCKQHGACELINYTKEDLKSRIKAISDGQGVNVIYDPVGEEYAAPAFRAIAWEGRYLAVGFAAGNIPSLPLNLPLLKGASIVGVFWGTFASKSPCENMANAQLLMQWQAEGKLKPHIHKIYSLEEGPKALDALMHRRVQGKLVIGIEH